jgi:hypothetical protein
MSATEQATQREVKVSVDYLPAAEDFRKDYPTTTSIETIRSDAKTFFGVQDRQERDTYFYFLVHDGQRIQDTSITLEQLIGPHTHAAHFSLVEEITACEC